MTGNDAIARVNFSALIKLNVLGLRFGDLDFRLESCGIGHARDGGAGRQLLTALERRRRCVAELLQHTVNARPNFQGFHLAAPELKLRAQLRDLGVLHGELRPGGVGADCQALLFDFQKFGEFLGFGLRLLQRERGHQAGFGQLVVHLEVELRAAVIGLSHGDRRFFRQLLGVQLNAEVGHIRFRSLQL